MSGIHYRLNGHKQGPVSQAELRKLYLNKTINQETPIWSPGLNRWVPLRTVAVLLQGPKVKEPMVPTVELTPEITKLFLKRGYDGAMIERFFAEKGKVVRYKYILSGIAVCYVRETSIHLIAPGKSRIWPGLGYSLLSLVMGWWSWIGMFMTPATLYENFRGGTDVTYQYYVMRSKRIIEERAAKGL